LGGGCGGGGGGGWWRRGGGWGGRKILSEGNVQKWGDRLYWAWGGGRKRWATLPMKGKVVGVKSESPKTNDLVLEKQTNPQRENAGEPGRDWL